MKQSQKETNDRLEERLNLKEEAKRQAEKARFNKDLDHFNDIRNSVRHRNKTHAELTQLMEGELQEFDDSHNEHLQNKQEVINERVQRIRDHLN